MARSSHGKAGALGNCGVCKQPIEGGKVMGPIEGKRVHMECWLRELAPKCECCGEVITGQCITICPSLVAAGKAGQVLAGGAGSPALEVSMADQELMDAKKHGLVSFGSSVKVFEEAAGR